MQMFFNERRYEVVAMVVAFVEAQLQWQATVLTSRLQQPRPQLLGKIGIGGTLINENLAKRARIGNRSRYLARIAIAPIGRVVAGMMAERFVPPGTVQCRADRRKR